MDPVVTYAYQQSVLKEEDVLLVNPGQQYPADKSVDASSSLRSTELNGFVYRNLQRESPTSSEDTLTSERPGSCGLFVVCDGHNGVTAARYVADQLPAYLDDLLPLGDAPGEDDPKGYTKWRHGLQRALTVSLALMHRAFAGLGVLAGCTVTIVLQHGWLLTTANLGDSRAVVDTGRSVVVLTDDHRVATHKQERRRLEKKGSIIAPVDIEGGGPATRKGATGVGPLRLWPGGLCLSRAIGDFDVGDSVLCLPYISQVLVPMEGARLLIASDGVWDAFEKTSRVTAIQRSQSTQAAPQRVINAIINTHEGLKDDTSLVVVDIMPPGKQFSDCISGRFGSVGGCLCMSGNKEPEPEPPQVIVLDEVDVARYAGLMAEPPTAVPAWFSDQLRDDLLETFEQAIQIWERASSMRRTGKVPSIADFEKLMVVAHVQRTSIVQAEQHVASHPAAADAAMADMSVRMGTAAKGLLNPQGDKEEVLNRKPGSLFPESSSTGSFDANPSVRFGNAVADTEDFGTKFGHYKRELQKELSKDPGMAMGRSGFGGSLQDQQGTGDTRRTFREGTSSNPHMMRAAAFPTQLLPPPTTVREEEHLHPALADMSVRGADSANQPGSVAGVGSHAADIGPPPDFSLRRNSVGSLVVPAECVKTLAGASAPATLERQYSPSGGVVDSIRRLSSQMMPGSPDREGSTRRGSSNEGSARRGVFGLGLGSRSREGSVREGSYGKHHPPPLTALQKATPVNKDGGQQRVRNGKPVKSVAFSD